MLLQQIVETLDAELDRLYRLRDIVSDIQGTPELAALAPQAAPAELDLPAIAPLEIALPLAAPAKVEPVRRKRTSTPSPRVKAPRPSAAELSALSGVIPAGPVVVSAAALAKENEGQSKRKKVVTPPPPPGSLGSMIRALHLDEAV